MKKDIKFYFLIIILSLIAGYAIFNLISREPITAENFKNKMENKGYIVSDSTSKFLKYSYIDKVYYAVSKDGKYQIDFFRFSDKKHTVDFYKNLRSIISQYPGSYRLQININLINYTAYGLKTYESYGVVSRIGNTVIRSISSSENEKSINRALIDLGYMEDFEKIFTSPIFMLACMIMPLILIASLWKLFVKAEKHGWISLIPVYNAFVLTKITFGSGWLVLLLLVPGINMFYAIYSAIKLAKVYGKSIFFGIGLLFLWPIFLPILAFGRSAYRGYD